MGHGFPGAHLSGRLIFGIPEENFENTGSLGGRGYGNLPGIILGNVKFGLHISRRRDILEHIGNLFILVTAAKKEYSYKENEKVFNLFHG